MRAAITRGPGSDRLDLCDDVELIDGPGPYQVYVQVEATGLCHSDLSAITGKMPLKVPGLPGHEAAGRVVEIGQGVEHLQPGDHVIVAAVPPCGRCRFCLRGTTGMCATNNPFGKRHVHHRWRGEDVHAFCGVGSFAERIEVLADAAIKIPQDVPFHVACIVGCAVVTGVGAVVNEAAVEPGASVVVIGCGGIGMSAILGARLAGASTIIAVDPAANRRLMAVELGATASIAPSELDVTSRALASGGFDYAIEAVGSAPTIRAAYDATRRGGTAVIAGMGDRRSEVTFNAMELTWNAKRLAGTYYGSGDVRVEFPRLLELWRAGRLDLDRLVTHRHSFDEINDGFAALQSGEGVRHVVEFAR